jgi:hypothetical protein
MLAVPERSADDKLIWHKPVGRIVGEFQAIACSDTEGITFPAPKQDVSLTLDKPDERWCADCLALTRSSRRR